ncbi:hypothetical protein [Geodermatophilus sp. SYSU D00815]
MNAPSYLVERAVNPRRQVEVLVDGRWWPGVQHGWRMYDDGSGWRAVVSFVVSTGAGLEAREDDVPVGHFRVRG